MSEQHVNEIALHGSSATNNAQTQKRILIAEDDDLLRFLLRDALSRDGYGVTAVPSAEDAIERLVLNRYDLVITDIWMGGMNGIDLARRLVPLYPNLPIVLITGQNPDAEFTRAAIQAGAADFITKPVALTTVRVIVERNLARHELMRKREAVHADAVVVSTIHVLAGAIDAREPFTAEHSRRVSALTLRIAGTMGLSADRCRAAELAAQVHDVGKIGIPDSILKKPGSLTDDERVVIREHAVKGSDIVGRVPELTAIASVVRHHHEYVDGNGYPDGLSGDQIPLEARIIAVADAFEVMTATRIYRQRLENSVAVDRLRGATGTQFDGGVVDAFLKLNVETLWSA